jgi:hypothetical protein
VTPKSFARPGLRPGRRLSALAQAVREHERTAAGGAVPKRPADHALYRRLTEIERGSHDRRNGA